MYIGYEIVAVILIAIIHAILQSVDLSSPERVCLDLRRVLIDEFAAPAVGYQLAQIAQRATYRVAVAFLRHSDNVPKKPSLESFSPWWSLDEAVRTDLIRCKD